MSAIDELVQANAQYAAGFDKGDLSMAPARHVAIVTCMDARILPARMLGLEEGDAHVIRNAGGRVQDALRSLVISQRLLGTDEVMVIHHADCGMLSFSNDDLHAKVEQDLGADDGGIDYLPFSDVQESVRDDVELLKGSPLIGDDVAIRGFVYDDRTGQVTEVG
jgi:carbonic anhydrase